MSKVLISFCCPTFKIVCTILLLLVTCNTFAQTKTKHAVVSVPAKVKATTAPEYYDYKRAGDNYTGLAVKLTLNQTANTASSYTLALTYTSTDKITLKTTRFVSANDALSLNVIADGIKYNDNKRFNSNMYHVNLADSDQIFLNTHPINKIILSGDGQLQDTLDITTPSFFTDQINFAKKASEAKPAAKKIVKKRKTYRILR